MKNEDEVKLFLYDKAGKLIRKMNFTKQTPMPTINFTGDNRFFKCHSQIGKDYIYREVV